MAFKKVKLEKGMYQEADEKGMTFSQLLEQLDPTDADEKNGEGCMDAFERQLAVRGLALSGDNAVRLAAFYDDSENRILFPELINRTIRQMPVGGKNRLQLSEIVAVTETVTQDVVKAAKMEDTEKNQSSVERRRVAEGAEFSEVSLKIGEKVVNLRKYGRKIKATYEYRRRVSFPHFKLALQQIVERWRKDELLEAFGVLNTAAGTPIDAATGGTLTYADCVNLTLGFPEHYDSTLFVANKAGCVELLNLEQFSDSKLYDTAKTGNWGTLLGNGLRRFDTALLDDKVLALDTRYSLARYVEKGSFIQETNKIIDGQWDVMTISQTTGFAPLFSDTVKLLDYSS